MPCCTDVKTGLSEPVLDTPGLPVHDSGNQSHLTRNHKEADTKPASLMREFLPSNETASLLVQIKRDLGYLGYKKIHNQYLWAYHTDSPHFTLLEAFFLNSKLIDTTCAHESLVNQQNTSIIGTSTYISCRYVDCIITFSWKFEKAFSKEAS